MKTRTANFFGRPSKRTGWQPVLPRTKMASQKRPLDRRLPTLHIESDWFLRIFQGHEGLSPDVPGNVCSGPGRRECHCLAGGRAGARDDQGARGYRCAFVGAVVFELPGGTEKWWVVEN